MSNVFDTEKIMKRIRELEDLPPFKPEPDELLFTVTHRFDPLGGASATLFFVVRNGEMIFYDPDLK
jgi:hypothetical protein